MELETRYVSLGVGATMAAAIEAHRQAREAFNAVTHLSDAVALGRKPTKAETRKWERAADAQQKALLDLCVRRARNPVEYHAKAEYLSALDYELDPAVKERPLPKGGGRFFFWPLPPMTRVA